MSVNPKFPSTIDADGCSIKKINFAECLQITDVRIIEEVDSETFLVERNGVKGMLKKGNIHTQSEVQELDDYGTLLMYEYWS